MNMELGIVKYVLLPEDCLFEKAHKEYEVVCEIFRNRDNIPIYGKLITVPYDNLQLTKEKIHELDKLLKEPLSVYNCEYYTGQFDSNFGITIPNTFILVKNL